MYIYITSKLSRCNRREIAIVWIDLHFQFDYQ
jgi:hypothetical protein